ncbi:MAG TPA: acyl-CoA dehydrogenase family protein [Trebonia sp.]|nr:acyl-CoA dehydrogenase family protein [Trebonia sp.]
MSTAQSVREQDRSGGRPSLDDLASRAAALRPLLAGQARATEANGRVSAEVIEQLASNGLLSACKPARFGGYEYGPSAMARIGYELGQACGATAWCAVLANCNSWFASYWTLRAQEDVWAGQPGNLIAATLGPTGQCELADGGYRLHGRWPFASNCDNSSWSVISAIIPEHDGIPSGPGWFLTPMTTLEIDPDSWQVAGLQGTGSKTLYADEPVFVPSYRMVRLSDVIALTTPGAAIEGNVLARFGFSTFGGAGLVSPLLGMARGALDWFTQNMRSKIRPGSPGTGANSPFVQARTGRAAAAIDAAVTLLLADLAAAEDLVRRGGALDVAGRIRIRRDIGFAARVAVDAVNSLYEAAGASSSSLDQPIQRFWRDVNAGARHVGLEDQSIMAMAGQQLLGLQPTGLY